MSELTPEQRRLLARIPKRTEAVRRRTQGQRGEGALSRPSSLPTRVEIPCTHEDREAFAREAKRLGLTHAEMFAALMVDVRGESE